jgi:hypothetical protein
MGKISTNELIQNALLSRQALLRSLIDPKRDIDAECGYPNQLTIEHYRILYEREGIAARCVGVMPDESWAMDPEIVESQNPTNSDFEQAWLDLIDRHNLFSYLQRADELSGVGAYGVLLLGIDDGKEMHLPVEGVTDTSDIDPIKTENGYKLLYVRPFDETVLTVDSYEMNVNSPRFGKPTMYSVTFQDVRPGQTTATSVIKRVHWSRLIHLADNRRNSEIYGTPRMQIAFNRLYDLRKLLGAAPEMFWKGGFPGLSLEVNPNLQDMELDKAATRQEMEDYMNGLQRYLALVGVSAKSLAPQVADPSAHFEMAIKSICISLKIPYRIFLGTEDSQLAGKQDTRAWNTRLSYRQQKYLNPFVLRPLLNRLMTYGVLPFVKKFFINWKDFNTLSDTEKAQIAVHRTDALTKYVAGGVDTLVPPEQYFLHFLELPYEETKMIIQAAKKWIGDVSGDDDEGPLSKVRPRDSNKPKPVNPAANKPGGRKVTGTEYAQKR